MQTAKRANRLREPDKCLPVKLIRWRHFCGPASTATSLRLSRLLKGSQTHTKLTQISAGVVVVPLVSFGMRLPRLGQLIEASASCQSCASAKSHRAAADNCSRGAKIISNYYQCNYRNISNSTTTVVNQFQILFIINLKLYRIITDCHVSLNQLSILISFNGECAYVCVWVSVFGARATDKSTSPSFTFYGMPKSTMRNFLLDFSCTLNFY